MTCFHLPLLNACCCALTLFVRHVCLSVRLLPGTLICWEAAFTFAASLKQTTVVHVSLAVLCRISVNLVSEFKELLKHHQNQGSFLLFTYFRKIFCRNLLCKFPPLLIPLLTGASSSLKVFTTFLPLLLHWKKSVHYFTFSNYFCHIKYMLYRLENASFILETATCWKMNVFLLDDICFDQTKKE